MHIHFYSIQWILELSAGEIQFFETSEKNNYKLEETKQRKLWKYTTSTIIIQEVVENSNDYSE